MSVAAKSGVGSIKITSCKLLTVHTVRGVSLNPKHATASNGRATSEESNDDFRRRFRSYLRQKCGDFDNSVNHVCVYRVAIC